MGHKRIYKRWCGFIWDSTCSPFTNTCVSTSTSPSRIELVRCWGPAYKVIYKNISWVYLSPLFLDYFIYSHTHTHVYPSVRWYLNYALGLVIRVNELPEKSVPNCIVLSRVSAKLTSEFIPLPLLQKLGSLSLLLVSQKGACIWSNYCNIFTYLFIFLTTVTKMEERTGNLSCLENSTLLSIIKDLFFQEAIKFSSIQLLFTEYLQGHMAPY